MKKQFDEQLNGDQMATFAARCIENEILMHLRSLKKTRKDVSLHDPIGTVILTERNYVYHRNMSIVELISCRYN
ncbi:hypothetical protein GC098_37090 [Paenibacillus sp. LMG 31458]|uniref:Uncharacterized protein n=1 Tax=Paenibacillus phytorum TaxID=2654977 RepID=A0ABX1Y7L1_9BACL|nr:hypothetical protein [Paenibacillus phytorum]NOU76915.1 hypothetical protein [Paenibacillus phytorum]